MPKKRKSSNFKFDNVFFQKVKKSKNFRALHELADKFKPLHYISTGIANVDMQLYWDDSAPWATKNTGEKRYGLPGNRVAEIAGESGAFKTYLGHSICAEVVRCEGMALHITTEYDIDEFFPALFYEEKTLTFLHTRSSLDFFRDIDGKRHFFAAANSYEKVEEIFGEFCNLVADARKDGFDGPAVVVLDSIATLYSKSVIKDSLGDESENSLPAYGAGAKEKHHLLSLALEKTAEHQICFLYLNQTRDKMGSQFRVPASDNVVKWYPTVRLLLQSWNGDKGAVDGVTHKYGTNIKCRLIKKRGYTSGLVDTIFQHFEADNYYGFDELDCGLKACFMSDLFKGKSSKYLDFQEEFDSSENTIYIKKFLDEHFSDGFMKAGVNAGKFSKKEDLWYPFMKETQKIDGGEFFLRMVNLGYEYGPSKYTMKEFDRFGGLDE